MSDQGDFLSRWSRRKRDVAAAEAETPEPEGATPSVAPKDMPPAPKADTALGETSFDPESLPPIESITAETDVRAFLAPGVPAELKRAALRRAWTADPAIRDFIGLSENSWDFNAPGAMGGFGPLEMTDDLRRMVAQLFTPGTEERPEGGGIPHRQPENSALESLVQAAENAQIPGPAQDEIAEKVEKPPVRDQLPQGNTNIAAVQQRPIQQADARSTDRRCHGGALPK